MAEETTDGGAPRVEGELAATERLVFFSDAVLAIALTLLAIDPPLPAQGTDAAMLRAASEDWPEYLARHDLPRVASHALVMSLTFAVSVPVFLVSGRWAFVIWAAVPLLVRAARLLSAARRRAPSPPAPRAPAEPPASV